MSGAPWRLGISLSVIMSRLYWVNNKATRAEMYDGVRKMTKADPPPPPPRPPPPPPPPPPPSAT